MGDEGRCLTPIVAPLSTPPPARTTGGRTGGPCSTRPTPPGISHTWSSARASPPHVDALRLTASVLAFFFAVGIAAHALDELHGHPLRTRITDRALIAATAVGLLVACGLGIAGVFRVGPVLIPFIVIGPFLVLAYNLELFGGRMHTDLAFAVSWGAFPLLTGYVAQAAGLESPAIVAAVAAVGFSLAQRSLSTPARALRRRVARVDGAVVLEDGAVRRLDQGVLLATTRTRAACVVLVDGGPRLGARRSAIHLGGRHVGEVAAEPVDRRVDHTIVAPPEHGVSEPRREAHGCLHHLDGPRCVDERLVVVAFEVERRRAFEVAVDRGTNSTCGLATVDDDIESHPIGKRRLDDAVQHGANVERRPRPPRTRGATTTTNRTNRTGSSLAHNCIGSHRKAESPLVLDHTRRTSHDVTVTPHLVVVDS